MNTLHFGTTYAIICIYIICCPYLTRKPTLSIFHQVINVVVMRKTFQDFVPSGTSYAYLKGNLITYTLIPIIMLYPINMLQFF